MKQKMIGPDVPVFLGAVFQWCFRWGCEVRLRNKNIEYVRPYDGPYMVNDTFERQRDGSLADLDHALKRSVLEIPELIFTRGERSIAIAGSNWESLIERFKYEHKRIFSELAVPFFDIKSVSP